MNKIPLIFAHRGAPNVIPENTIESFLKAAELGCDGFECDVHLSLDGIPAVIHDSTIDRTTSGTGNVCDYTMEELRGFDAAKHYSPNNSNIKVPSIYEVLELAKDLNKYLVIELKGSYNGLEAAVIKAIESLNYFDRTIISSFNQRYLLNIKNIFPGVKTELDFFWEFHNPVYAAHSLGLYCLCPHYYYLESSHIDYVPSIKRNGIFLNTFTVNKIEQAERLIKIGVDGIMSDEAGILYNKLHS